MPTLDLGVCYQKNVIGLDGYTDADYAGVVDGSKSVSEHIFMLAHILVF